MEHKVKRDKLSPSGFCKGASQKPLFSKLELTNEVVLIMDAQ